jgi:hypothetical protein
MQKVANVCRQKGVSGTPLEYVEERAVLFLKLMIILTKEIALEDIEIIPEQAMRTFTKTKCIF